MTNEITRIAVEEAFVTPRIAQAWKDALQRAPVEPGFRKMGETILGEGPGARRIHEQLVDLDVGRIRGMNATGIHRQLLSLTSPGVQVFAPDLASALCIEANDCLAEAIRRHPTRFAGLAAIAPQDAGAAVREIERAIGTLHLSGIIVNSHTYGEYLDAKKFWPILEAAQAVNAPIYLHPREPSPRMIDPFLDYGLYFAGWGFAAETGLHAMRLIMSGVFDQLPSLRIVLGHMGEGIPFWLQRIDNRYELQVKIGAVTKLRRLPSEYFLDHFVVTTSGVTDPLVLRFMLDKLGVDRILFAADYPYESVEEAVAFMDAAELSDTDRRKIYCENATRVFNLSTVS